MNLFRLRTDHIGCCAKLPGYKRAAYGVAKMFGVGYVNVCSLRHFALCAHLNQSNGDMLVEILQVDGEWNGENDFAPIDCDTFHKLLDDVPDYCKDVVYKDGRPFFKGYWTLLVPEGRSHSFDRCAATNACHGDGFATTLAFPDKVHSIVDGFEFNTMLERANNFKVENAGQGTISYDISRVKKNIEHTQAEIAALDKELRNCNEIYARANEVLAKYGITYKAE